MTLPYSAGTVAVTANATAVTGSGTAWSSQGFQAGDQLWLKGLSVTIATVTDDTHLTLAFGWPGATASGAAYELRYQDAAARAQTTLTALLAQIGNGNIGSLAELDTAADTLAYYDAAGHAALLDFPAGSRDQISAGLNNAARSRVQTSPLDATAGRLMAVGAFGLGTQIVATQTDLNTYVQGGSYITPSTGVTNLPAGWPQARYVMIVGGGVSYAAQILRSPSGNRTAIRSSTGGIWESWTILTDGAATGTNANGSFFRTAGGLQICTAMRTLSYTNASVLSNAWSYPAAFTGTPSVINQPTQAPGGGHRESTHYCSAGSSTATLSVIDNAGSYTGGETIPVSVIAIGAWQ